MLIHRRCYTFGSLRSDDRHHSTYTTDFCIHAKAFKDANVVSVGYTLGCRRIAVSLLPERKESDLILYYYNVWKTRATPRARSWFTALEQVAPPPPPSRPF